MLVSIRPIQLSRGAQARGSFATGVAILLLVGLGSVSAETLTGRVIGITDGDRIVSPTVMPTVRPLRIPAYPAPQ